MQAEAKRLDVEHAKAKKLTAEMHQALEAKDWNSVVNLSEQLLGVSNRHPMALQMRQRAITEARLEGKNTRKFMSLAIKWPSQCLTPARTPNRVLLIATAKQSHALDFRSFGSMGLVDMPFATLSNKLLGKRFQGTLSN